MGLSTNASLTHMLERCETPSMRSFVRSIIQGEALGVSMGQIMRNLASETRKRRRQHAEERAHKAPVKMLFPLILLMFPSMFIVLLYPAAAEVLGGAGGLMRKGSWSRGGGAREVLFAGGGGGHRGTAPRAGAAGGRCGLVVLVVWADRVVVAGGAPRAAAPGAGVPAVLGGAARPGG